MKRIYMIRLLFLTTFLMTACGTIQVGIERTTTPDQAATATMAAVMAEGARLAMQLATLSISPTPASQPWDLTSAPTALPPGLVYQVADELWKVNATGQPELIFSPGEDQAQHLSRPLLSPDGDQVLFWDRESTDLWLADLTTGLRRNLTNTPDDSEGLFRWWPGRPDMILFGAQPRESWPEPRWVGYLGAVGVDEDSYRILDGQNNTHGMPAPSPDGQTIAYGAGNTAWLYRWETGPEPFDPADYGWIGAESVDIGSPAWSPDGAKLAWVVDGGGLSPDGRVGIGLFDLQARTARLLHSYEPLGMDGWPPRPLWSEGWPPAPLWSPDGRWLAFVTLAQNPVEAGLWVVQADGQAEQKIPLATGRNDGLAWSPDGRWLVFSTTTETSRSSTWIVEVGTWSRHPVDLPQDAVIVDWLALSPSVPISTPAPPVFATAEPAPVVSTPTVTPLPPPTLTPVPLSILSFGASPAVIEPGAPVTLTWNAVAERVSIVELDGDGRLTSPGFDVPLSGTLVITSQPTLRNRADFMLIACSGDPDVCDQAQASVEILCPDEWFFPNPPTSCPVAPHRTNLVAQHFENGLMLWLEAAGEIHILNEIVILYDDGLISPRWQMVIDDWSSGMPQQDPSIVPPPGYFQPVRGFGKVWREVSGVRERLGWATDQEFVVGEGVFQCEAGKYGRCYVTGPDRVIYVLEPEMSGWNIYEQ